MVTNQPGDVIEARFEFQTWLLAPCLGDIEDGTLMEVQPGGGNPATGLLPCETFPAQPEQPMRIPVGRVEWGFTTTVTVGKDADSTSFTHRRLVLPLDRRCAACDKPVRAAHDEQLSGLGAAMSVSRLVGKRLRFASAVITSVIALGCAAPDPRPESAIVAEGLINAPQDRAFEALKLTLADKGASVLFGHSENGVLAFEWPSAPGRTRVREPSCDCRQPREAPPSTCERLGTCRPRIHPK